MVNISINTVLYSHLCLLVQTFVIVNLQHILLIEPVINSIHASFSSLHMHVVVCLQNVSANNCYSYDYMCVHYCRCPTPIVTLLQSKDFSHFEFACPSACLSACGFTCKIKKQFLPCYIPVQLLLHILENSFFSLFFLLILLLLLFSLVSLFLFKFIAAFLYISFFLSFSFYLILFSFCSSFMFFSICYPFVLFYPFVLAGNRYIPCIYIP